MTNGFSPSFNAYVANGSLFFGWQTAGENVSYNGASYYDFKYYKVVASLTNPSPLYPGDGYLTAITYVYGNGKFSSNVIRMTVPEYTINVPVLNSPINISAIQSGPGSDIVVSWPKAATNISYNGKVYSGFNYYKIVATQNTGEIPVYPKDGYLTYESNVNSTSKALRPNQVMGNLSGIGVNELKTGETYYVSITYCYNSGCFSTPVVPITIQ